MIWTVQPESPDIRTRTSRKPSSASTGSASAASRAATPSSRIRRASANACGSVIPVIRRWSAATAFDDASVSSMGSNWCRSRACDRPLRADRGNKKERAPGGTHSQKPTGSNPTVMRCPLWTSHHRRQRKYSDFTGACKPVGGRHFRVSQIRETQPIATNCKRPDAGSVLRPPVRGRSSRPAGPKPERAAAAHRRLAESGWKARRISGRTACRAGSAQPEGFELTVPSDSLTRVQRSPPLSFFRVVRRFA